MPPDTILEAPNAIPLSVRGFVMYATGRGLYRWNQATGPGHQRASGGRTHRGGPDPEPNPDPWSERGEPAVTMIAPDTTVAEIDEALANLRTTLANARRQDNEARVIALEARIDTLLERRHELSAGA